MSTWITGKTQIATADDLATEWNCGRPGQYFRCGFCGYKFKIGDQWRAYMNSNGNPFVCKSCDDTNDNLKTKWQQKRSDWNTIQNDPQWWYFRKRQ